MWRLSLSIAREGAYMTSITFNSLTLDKIYCSDQHHCVNAVIERSSSSPGQHATLNRRDKFLPSNSPFSFNMQLPTSAASETSVSVTKLFSALYNPPASTIRISGGLGGDSPTVSAPSIHCQTLRTLELVKYVLRCEISGPSKLQNQ